MTIWDNWANIHYPLFCQKSAHLPSWSAGPLWWTYLLPRLEIYRQYTVCTVCKDAHLVNNGKAPKWHFYYWFWFIFNHKPCSASRKGWQQWSAYILYVVAGGNRWKSAEQDAMHKEKLCKGVKPPWDKKNWSLLPHLCPLLFLVVHLALVSSQWFLPSVAPSTSPTNHGINSLPSL